MFLQNKPSRPLHSYSTARAISPSGRWEMWQHLNITVRPSSNHRAGRAQTLLSEGRQGPLAEPLLIHACFHSPLSTASSQHSPSATGLTELQPGLQRGAHCHSKSPGAASPTPASPAAHPQPVRGAGSLAQVQGGGSPSPMWRAAAALARCSCSWCRQKWLQMTIWLHCVCCEQLVGLRKPP